MPAGGSTGGAGLAGSGTAEAGGSGTASTGGSATAGTGGSGTAGAGGSATAGTGGTATAGTGGTAGSGGSAGALSTAKLCADLIALPSDCACAENEAHAYLFCSTALPWPTAASQCAFYEMRLTRIESPAENSWLIQRASKILVPTAFENFWLGGATVGATGTWSWPDGTVLWTGGAGGAAAQGVYVAWRASNPSSNTSGACMYMGSSGWQDTSCSHARDYVCEAY